MSDLFQEQVPAAFVARVWSVMREADWHIYQILTKRPDIMLRVLSDVNAKPLPHVWLGTSVESSGYVERIDVLRRVPAAVRFVSFEPLLAPVGDVELEGIDWAIVGGESGPSSRPIERRWVEQIKRQCRKSDTAFFFKQWGGTNKKATGRLLNGRTFDEYPPSPASSA